MDQIIDGIARFQTTVFEEDRALYGDLARNGQAPKALMISCSDSRVVPEIITQSAPGDIFVTRNAGNIVPPYGETTSGVAAAIEYAVVGLEVKHVIVCGHSDCGAMKALLHPEALDGMPTVAAWLGHCRCAHGVFAQAHGAKIADKEAARLLAMENVVAQLTHLRTHPSVASRVATGDLSLHGWLFDIESGTILALDGDTGRFAPIRPTQTLPVALRSRRRAVETPRSVAA